MSRADDIASLAGAIRRDLRDGAWHKAVGLGGWGHPPSLTGDALNQLLDAGAIEYDARRRVYRLIPTPAAQQLTLTEEAT